METNGKRYCTSCGKKLVDEAMFCPECGEPVEEFLMSNFEKSEKDSFPTLDKKRKSRGKILFSFIVATVVIIIIAVFTIKFVPDILGNKEEKKTTVKENSKKIKAKESAKTRETKALSVKATLNGIGDIEFIVFNPDTSVNKYADAIFHVKLQDGTDMKLPAMEQNNIRTGKEYEKIEDFSFTDYNDDKLDDIMIINIYKVNNDTEKEVRFYMQETNKTFTLDQQLSEEINSEVADKTVINIKNFLEKNKETDITENTNISSDQAQSQESKNFDTGTSQNAKIQHIRDVYYGTQEKLDSYNKSVQRGKTMYSEGALIKKIIVPAGVFPESEVPGRNIYTAEYYYEDNELLFAFVYGNGEEYRYYMEPGNPDICIRYIGNDGVIKDFINGTSDANQFQPTGSFWKKGKLDNL